MNFGSNSSPFSNRYYHLGSGSIETPRISVWGSDNENWRTISDFHEIGRATLPSPYTIGLVRDPGTGNVVSDTERVFVELFDLPVPSPKPTAWFPSLGHRMSVAESEGSTCNREYVTVTLTIDSVDFTAAQAVGVSVTQAVSGAVGTLATALDGATTTVVVTPTSGTAFDTTNKINVNNFAAKPVPKAVEALPQGAFPCHSYRDPWARLDQLVSRNRLPDVTTYVDTVDLASIPNELLPSHGLCATGIMSTDHPSLYCCASSCNQCGGTSCAPSSCCHDTIEATKKICSKPDDVACAIPASMALSAVGRYVYVLRGNFVCCYKFMVIP